MKFEFEEQSTPPAALLQMSERFARKADRLITVREIREALAADQIVPYYQPKICLASGRVVGLEALVRWQHAVRGVLGPGHFATTLEDPEVSVMICGAMLRQTVTDLGNWLTAGLDCGRVALNLSAADFDQPGLADTVLDRLTKARVPATRFEVEVTEAVQLDTGASFVLDTLNEAGVTIALDDFGTGFASLTHLLQFPVDVIKIDQSFVRGLEEGRDRAIVRALIELGKDLRMQVVAEGVENAQQAKKLQQMGCDVVQGHHFARPMLGSRVPWFVSCWNNILPGADLGRRPAVPDARITRHH